MAATTNTTDIDMSKLDDMSRRLREESLKAMEDEPQLTILLKNTVLAPGVETFEEAVANTITYRLLLRPCNGQKPSDGGPTMFCPKSLRGILADAMKATDYLELGHTMSEAVRLDVQAVCERDPAVDSLLEVVLFLKGFAALVCHRAAYHKWHSARAEGRKSMVALWLQSQASAVFGLDIHPAATMGAGILLDHGTGIVIGETAKVGDGCTLLHGVTLGGTGKQSGDRHPKVGNDVLIGANASLLGNIEIGNGAKIGAGSIVLGPIPSGATAVGAPAKIIGRAREAKPASTMDETLQQVSHLHKSTSSSTVATTATSMSSMTGTESAKEETGWEDDAPNDEKSNGDTKETNKELKGKDSTADTTNCCCPYRDYAEMGQSAPPGSITLGTVKRLLEPEGCAFRDIGGVLFALDTRVVGYVKPEVFFSKETQRVIVEKTKLPADRVAALMSEFQQRWQAHNGVLEDLKKATASKGIVAPQIVSTAC